MSIRLCIILLAVFFLIQLEGKPVSKGNLPLTRAVNHLLNITETEKKFNTVIEAYVSSDPNLSPLKSEILSFMNKFLSYQSLRPHIVEIYRDLYTLSDINGLIKFYSSSLGKKLLKTQVKVETRLSQLVKIKLTEQMPQITAWFQQVLNKKISSDRLDQTIQSIH